MQRLYTILFIILCACSLSARTPQEAAQIASEFIYQRNLSATPALRIQRASQAAVISTPVELVHTQYQADKSTPAVYVFNNQQAEGFVLISAIDNARSVLGYADQGNFNPNDIPCNLQLWLQMYAEELAYASFSPQRAASNPSLNTQYPDIAPLLGETQWGQGKPYNNMCPLIDGARSVAGCVATALSQIMYKHQYPLHGTGSNSYRLRNGTQLSVDFSEATYDWENMLPKYKKSYTQEQADAVAELVYHVGVACNMSYSPSASGAVSQLSLQAMHKYFGYDAGLTPLLKDYMSEDKILTAMAADLKQGLPIYMSGSTINYEGHAFVCDGMQSNGYLHINWGWDGAGDGYYSLSALDPGQHGTGGSAQNLAFTVDVCAYTNLRPDQGGIPQPLLSVDGQVRSSKAQDKRNEYIKFEQTKISDDLLEEVTYICEYPVAVTCDYDNAYLTIPQEVAVTVMETHQRYFALYTKEGKLTNKFVTITNYIGNEFENIKAGNLRVIKARLDDAVFFFNEDTKKPLEAYRENLKGMTFQKGMGTIYDKTQRLIKLSDIIAKELNNTSPTIIRTAQLCKADLCTSLVFEFTELQGFIGSDYALNSIVVTKTNAVGSIQEVLSNGQGAS